MRLLAAIAGVELVTGSRTLRAVTQVISSADRRFDAIAASNSPLLRDPFVSLEHT